MASDRKFLNKIQVLVNYFVIENGKIKILLEKKCENPFKGYWMLPMKVLESNEKLSDCFYDISSKILDYDALDFEQVGIFNDFCCSHDKNIIEISLMSVIDDSVYQKYELKDEKYELFDINEIPKMIYDQNILVCKNISLLKIKYKDIVNFKKLFPLDFTISELKSVYELINDKICDNRNFRKKFISYLEETEFFSENTNGRPAKLYRFKTEKIS